MRPQSTVIQQKESIEEWWKQEVKQHSFCVILFYRGRSAYAGDYLSTFAPYAKELRNNGGELFVVVPKYNKVIKNEKMKNLNFKVINDTKNYLVNYYKISTNMPAKKKFFCLLSGKHPCDSFLCSQPGVAIVSKPKNFLGQIISKFTIKDQYDTKERLTPSDVRELVNLHFGTQHDSKDA